MNKEQIMSNEQLLRDLVEWFQIMCSLDMQSEAEDLLDDAAERPHLSAWEEYRILTDGIHEAIQERQQVSALKE